MSHELVYIPKSDAPARSEYGPPSKSLLLMVDLVIGRAMLLRAIGHLKAYTRKMDLDCLLRDEQVDHIGKWKAAGKEDGFSNCEDEYDDVMDCPRCSAEYATFKAKKLMAGRCGRINGILTRMGKNWREKNNVS